MQPMFGDAFQWHFPAPPQGDSLTVIVDILQLVSKPAELMLRSLPKYSDPPSINLNFFVSDLNLTVLV